MLRRLAAADRLHHLDEEGGRLLPLENELVKQVVGKAYTKETAPLRSQRVATCAIINMYKMQEVCLDSRRLRAQARIRSRPRRRPRAVCPP